MRHRVLSYDLVTRISKQYSSRFEFQKGDKAAYNKALKEGWIDSYTWIGVPVRKVNDSLKRVHLIYAYLDEVNKVVYIGRTNNIRRRHSQHNRLSYKYKTYDVVKRYFMSIGVLDELPDPTIIETGLTLVESQEKEEYYINQYRSKGWQILNTAKTGANVSSTGSFVIKWTYENCKEIALSCKTRKEFEKKNTSAYNVSKENGWIDEWLPISSRYHAAEYTWTKEMCDEIARKYTSFTEFSKKEPKAYSAARRNGWLKEFDWLNKAKRENITEEEIIRLAKKFTYASDFKREHPSHYHRARRMGILKELGFKPKEAIKWTYEVCYTEACKYSSQMAFMKASPNAYNVSQRKGWIDEWYSNSPDYQKTDFLIAKESCIETSKEYSSFKEFHEKEPKAYNLAQRHRWLKEMSWLKKSIISREEVYIIAQRYKYASDFKREHPSHYAFAKKTGILKELGFKPKDTSKWTYETCKAEASKYTCQIEFRKACPVAYNISLRNKWINHWLPKTVIIRSDEELIEIAKQFKNINDLRKKNGSLYCLLLKRGLLERTSLQYLRKKWTDEKVKEEAARYETRTAFQKGSKGAYNYAQKNKMLDELFPKVK